jgi:hypothetical protein
MEFILAFIHRSLSGAQSMFGYKKNEIGFLLTSLIMCIYPLLFPEIGVIFYLYVLVNVMIVYMKIISFKMFPDLTFMKKYSDIHLWEELVTGGFVLYMTLLHYNIFLLMCSVYPALLLHKGFINIGNNLPFFSSKTDDPTGKTFGIPLLGLKIRRSGTTLRIFLAIVSLIMLSLILIFGWSWKI